MASPTGHLSDDELTDLTDLDTRGKQRVRGHLQSCESCRRRVHDLKRLRELLAQTGRRERRARRNPVPSAMMRLRLRRHSISNANEVLGGFAALLRAVASLFSLGSPDARMGGRARREEDEHHE